MTNIFTDIINFLKSLAFVDFVLYFSVLVLIILVVSLIYIIKTSSDDIDSEDSYENNSELDLVALTKEIDEHTPYNIELTDYETEQEEKAIISYDELIKHKNYALNYENESIKEGINIKKIDNSNPVNETEEEQPIKTNYVMSYEREEEFLKILKQLNSLLN